MVLSLIVNGVVWVINIIPRRDSIEILLQWNTSWEGRTVIKQIYSAQFLLNDERVKCYRRDCFTHLCAQLGTETLNLNARLLTSETMTVSFQIFLLWTCRNSTKSSVKSVMSSAMLISLLKIRNSPSLQSRLA